MAKTNPSKVTVELSAKTEIGSVTFDIALTMRKGMLRASLSSDKGIGLPELIKAFDATAEIPSVLNDLPKITAFYIQYASKTTSKSYTIGLKSKLAIGGAPLDLFLEFSSVDKGGVASTQFAGALTVAGHSFKVGFMQKGDQSVLFAKYAAEHTITLNFQTLGHAIFHDHLTLPDVEINISKPNIFFLWIKDKNVSKIAIGLGAGLNINLSTMPLVGEWIGDPKLFAIQEVLVMYANRGIDVAELQDINTRFAEAFPAQKLLPETNLAEGLNFTATLSLNGQDMLFAIMDSVPLQKESSDEVVVTNVAPSKSPAVVDKSTPPSSPDAPGVKWKNVDKTLGPVELKRVGFAYAKSKLTLLLDANMKLAGLSANLVGLGFGFEIKWPPSWPSLYLSGLGLAYTSPAFSISGMFLVATPEKDEEYAYYGSLGFGTKAFSIGGVGAYSKLKTGEHSFFAYAMYQGPIGGPAFFFVTGIALGFGINRTVRVPAIGEVKDFPLVAMALGQKPDRTLNDLLMTLERERWITASKGNYWFAIGIKFSSFKLVDSFVLLIVGFGTRLEITILGLSLLAWPNKSNPIVYIELAIKAHFATDSDLISVEGMITPNSFILDRNCKLSGGFAFYVWVSGEHEGDFVVTMGGYHPNYKIPAHYPKVDRLALDWKIGPLSIRGEMYFALTPRCIMLGGMLVAEYKLSFLQVYFSFWFDAYIAWAPFQYDLSGGVRLKIELTLKIWGIGIHFSLSIGANLRIYGPPFAGHIEVDLGFYSFRIPFGDGNKKEPKKLKWSDSNQDYPGFLESFVPTKDDKKQPLDTRVTAGIIATVKENNKVIYLVNAYDLVLTVESFFPLQQIVPENGIATITDATLMQLAGVDAPMRYKDRKTAFGILPMGVPAAQTTLKFSLKRGTEPVKTPFAILTKSKGITSALWAAADPKENTTVPTILQQYATGLELHTTEREDGKLEPLSLSTQRQKRSEEMVFWKNADAGSSEAISIQRFDIAVATDIAGMFNGLGFELEVPDRLDYGALNIQRPTFSADIGQKIPDKVT